MNSNKQILIGVDPGDTHTGLTLVGEFGILHSEHISNFLLIDFIYRLKEENNSVLVIIEDMRPYNMRINDNVINTIKYIGQIEWRLQELKIKYLLVPRWQIKNWVHWKYRDMCAVEINKKIEYAAVRKAKILGIEDDGKRRKESYVYVDDRIVERGMRLWWDIKKPKVGQKVAFGLKTHGWSALAMVTFYIEKHAPSFLQKKASD
jgi:hypothetical protein